MPEHASKNFKLKGLVARNVGVEPEDTVLTKRTLNRLGFYEVPDYGLTPWPDGGMFQAIESFQGRNRLKVDGVMAPGEETEAWLGKALRGEKRQISDIFGLGSYVGPGRANRPEDVRLTKRALALAGHYPADLARDPSGEADSLLARGISRFQSKRGLKQDGLMGPGGETERELERTVQSAQQAQGKKANPQPPTKETQRPKDDGKNPTFNKFRDRLKPREGVFADNPEDPGGPTLKGISQETLNQLNEQHSDWGLPKDTKDLSDEQINGIFRSEYFDRPKIQKVQDIPGIGEKAPQLPEQLFDAGVLHGIARAGRWLQQSLDEQIGTDLKTEGEDGSHSYDGNVGPKTREAITKAIGEGKIQAVNDSMVDKRVDFMKKQPNESEFPGWIPRANSFRVRQNNSDQ